MDFRQRPRERRLNLGPNILLHVKIVLSRPENYLRLFSKSTSLFRETAPQYFFKPTKATMQRRKFFAALLPAAVLGAPRLAQAQAIAKPFNAGQCLDRDGASPPSQGGPGGLGVIDGTNQVFRLLHKTIGNASVGVFVNGLKLAGGYTIAEQLLTLDKAPEAGASLEVWYWGNFTQ